MSAPTHYSGEAVLITVGLMAAVGVALTLLVALLGGPWIAAVTGSIGGIVGWLLVQGITALHARLRPNTNRETA